MKIISLDQLSKNQTGFMHSIGKVPKNLNLSQEEFEKRLLEMGFNVGTAITLLHEGPIGKDPIAVRIDNCYTLALRRNEASAIHLSLNQ